MIGIFDSGIGGLTVASALRKQAPEADLLYFGDLANMPYGSKSKEELFQLTMRAMFFLRSHGAVDYVAACNSVSVAVIQPLKDLFGVRGFRVIEMVEPAAKALKEKASGMVLVAATEATVRSGIYEHAFRKQGLTVEMIACPELAFAIECGKSKDDISRIIQPVIEKAIEIKAKTLVFGCTQYPFIKSVFAKAFQSHQFSIDLFDPSDSVAREAISMCEIIGKGLNTFFVSKHSEVFDTTVFRLFGNASKITCVDVDNIENKHVDK